MLIAVQKDFVDEPRSSTVPSRPINKFKYRPHSSTAQQLAHRNEKGHPEVFQ